MSSTARATPAMLLIGSLALIVMATTMPWSYYFVGHPHWANVEWIPFSRRIRPDDFLLNVLLFAPFGYSAVRALIGEEVFTARQARMAIDRRLWAIVLAGTLISASVELFQVYCHGRIPTTTDIISNTLGTCLGVWRATRPDEGPYSP